MCLQPSQDHFDFDFSLFFSHPFHQKLVDSLGVGYFPLVILCSLQMLITLHNAVLIGYIRNYKQHN